MITWRLVYLQLYTNVTIYCTFRISKNLCRYISNPSPISCSICCQWCNSMKLVYLSDTLLRRRRNLELAGWNAVRLQVQTASTEWPTSSREQKFSSRSGPRMRPVSVIQVNPLRSSPSKTQQVSPVISHDSSKKKYGKVRKFWICPSCPLKVCHHHPLSCTWLEPAGTSCPSPGSLRRGLAAAPSAVTMLRCVRPAQRSGWGSTLVPWRSWSSVWKRVWSLRRSTSWEWGPSTPWEWASPPTSLRTSLPKNLTVRTSTHVPVRSSVNHHIETNR